MWAYLVRRFVQAIFILLIITVLCFILTRLSSDPMSQYAERQGMTAADREAIRARLGLDQPMPVQYVKWLGFTGKSRLILFLPPARYEIN